MFVGLVVFLLLGFPVAFCLAACGLFFGLIGIEFGSAARRRLLQALPLRIFGIMQNDTLLAIPFFTFMGLILERCGMAEDLLDTIGQLFGPIRGGLALRGDLGRRDAGGNHRRGRRVGDLDGPDLAADHAALRLRPAHRHRRDRRLRHAGADHPAVAGADHPGRPARPQRRRHVQGRVHPRLRADRAVCAVRADRHAVPAELGARRCRRKPARSAKPTERRGLRSLGVLVLLSIAAGRLSVLVLGRDPAATTPTDETIVVSMCVGVGVAFVLAVAQPAAQAAACCRAWPSASTFVLIPPLALIFLVLGTIFLGVATPTEGGAMGATARW